jgi:hypothetical protein
MQNATSTATAPQIWVAPEDTNEFEHLKSALHLEFAPSTEFQFQCVLTILHCLWTIRRTRIAECKMQERAYNNGLIDPLLHPDWAKQLKGILEMRCQAERSRIQAIKDFHAAPRPRPDKEVAAQELPPPPPSEKAEAAASTSNPAKVIGMPNREPAIPVNRQLLKLAS